MSKSFPLDFIRQLIEQALLEEHIKNPRLVGGENQVSLFSFYEQLEQGDNIDRFTEIYRDLIDQQNRAGLIANGVIVAPENPTITNLNQCDIIPMTFTATFRCTLADRDIVLESLNNIIKLYKGRKVDIAEFNTGKLLKVGTFGNNAIGNPILTNGDFIGDNIQSGSDITSKIQTLVGYTGINFSLDPNLSWLYASYNGIISIYKKSGNLWSKYENPNEPVDIIFPPTHTSFTKWKVSVSFDALRCDEPRTLNAEEYCAISFSGSATLVNANVMLGNDILKLGIRKYKIKGNPDIAFQSNYGLMYWLEPLEIPSSNNANTLPNQLLSNAFKTNSHTDSINLSLQYTFVVDTSIAIIKQFYNYARYGEQLTIGTVSGQQVITTDGISPNVIYSIYEIYNTWGEFEYKEVKAKVVESIDIDNTESDALSITIPFQIQGDN